MIPFNEKWNVVKSEGVCFICLIPGHQCTECTAQKCGICAGPHHNLLHNPRRIPQDNETLIPNGNNYNANLNFLETCEVKSPNNELEGNKMPGRSFLPIVSIKIRNNTYELSGSAFLDSGSEINILSTKCCNQLKLKGEPVMINIVGAGGIVIRKNTKKITLTIVEDSGTQTEIECIVLDDACGKGIPMGKEILERFNEYDTTKMNPWCNKKREIDILIGMSSPQFHKRKIIKEERNGLTLIETPFGICVVGPVPKGDQVNYMSGIIHSNHVTLEYDDIKYENEFKFVEAEMAGISKECPCLTKTDDELKFEKLMETSWSKDEDGRLQVQLPWKVDPNTLENTRIQAINRDIKIRQQMAKKLGVMKLFAEQINEMIKEGVLH